MAVGVSKVQILKGKYEALEFLEEGGGALQQKTFHVGGMDIFWNNTCMLFRYNQI